MSENGLIRVPSDDAGLEAAFEELVREFVSRYVHLERLASARLEAIRRSDRAGLASVIAEENEAIQAVAALEKRRVAIVDAMSGRLGSTERTATRLGWIAERLEGGVGERTRGMVASLRSAMERLARTNEVSARAAEALVAHMRGLLRGVAHHLNHAKTYGRSGVVEAGPAIVSAVDVRS